MLFVKEPSKIEEKTLKKEKLVIMGLEDAEE